MQFKIEKPDRKTRICKQNFQNYKRACGNPFRNCTAWRYFRKWISGSML